MVTGVQTCALPISSIKAWGAPAAVVVVVMVTSAAESPDRLAGLAENVRVVVPVYVAANTGPGAVSTMIVESISIANSRHFVTLFWLFIPLPFIKNFVRSPVFFIGAFLTAGYIILLCSCTRFFQYNLAIVPNLPILSIPTISVLFFLTG